MIYSATIKQARETAGQLVVTPLYTRVDGLPAPDILALAANGIEPVAGDIVLCAESINPFDHSSVRSFDNNGGSCPIIIATFAELFTTLCDIVIKGKSTLGAGTDPMVLGNALAAWAQAKDAEIAALYAWGLTVTPPFPGTPAQTNWNANNLSANHKLD
jgi:hypothetical protein